MEGESLTLWVGKELSQLLGFDASGDFSEYLLSIETKSDLEEYLKELLDPTQTRHTKFIQQLLKRWQPKGRSVEQAVPEGVTVYKKDSSDDRSPVRVSRQRVNKSEDSPKAKPESSPKNRDENEPDVSQESRKSRTPTQKTKFIPLYSPEGRDKTVIQIPGRHPCLCQAHKHGLINNCLSCGRVVCKQEGSGPCVFCGNLVCTEDELEIITRGSRKSDKLEESLMRGSAVPKFPPPGEDDQSKKAREHKDKLISYDKSSARRTKVIDDESDYYATDNKWLSSQERERLQKKKDDLHSRKHASRRDKKITFDFAGRQLVDATFDTRDVDELLNSEYNSFGGDITNIHKHMTSGISNPAYLNPEQRPQFLQDDDSMPSKSERLLSKTSLSAQRAHLRLQDKGVQEVADNGMCLSMHQPWASLLVAGIKIHEGRSWYSPHRGRLWIASTARSPAEPEVQELEKEYAQRLGSSIKFPESYPESCLLGCVDVTDVVPQTEYRQQFANGESSSPYVFICEHPQELTKLKFPIKGQHKIYKLDSQIHKAARMGL